MVRLFLFLGKLLTVYDAYSYFRPDAYNYYVIYIECVFKLMNSENKLQTDMQNCSLSDSSEGETLPNAFNTHKGEILKPDDTIEQCVKFIKRCQKENESPHRLRGPHLALLLLYRRLSEDHLNPSKYLGKLFIDINSN